MSEAKPKGMGGQVVFTQDDRYSALLTHPTYAEFRKTARIIAVKQDKPFMVYTEHGPIAGAAGDWLATNHPEDDPGSDIWPVSAARMEATYVPVNVKHPGQQHEFKTECTKCGEYGQLFVAILGPNEKATIGERE